MNLGDSEMFRRRRTILRDRRGFGAPGLEMPPRDLEMFPRDL